MDFLATRIKHIPAEAWRWIIDNFPQRFPKCPEVLHSAILAMWHAWRAEHPEKCAGDPALYRACPNENCRDGWMTFWRREKFYRDRLTSFVVNCADCRRSRNTNVPAMSMKRCLDLGWEPDCFAIRQLHIEETREEAEARTWEFRNAGRRQIHQYEEAV